MKRKYLLPIFMFLIIVVSFIAFANKAVSVGTTQYHDWKDITEIGEDYSYSTLFISPETTIKVIKDAGSYNSEYSSSLLNRDYIRSGELIVLITNCATNKNGELLDVVVKINNVKKFENASSSNGYVTFQIGATYEIPKDPKDPSSYDSYTQDSIENALYQPLLFTFDTKYAQANFTMTYYKAGTYQSESNKGELGNINSISGIYWDFDIENNDGDYNNELFNGDEGMAPIVGTSDIYYNKDKKHFTYNHTLKEQDNGIAISDRTSSNTNAIYYESSAFMTTKDIEDSTFSFTYSGRGCGIYYMFASPYPFEIDSPKKSVNVAEAKTGDSFIYTVSQYIPNNYYGTLFSFNRIYDGLYATTRYNQIVIKDTIDSHLTIDKNNIKVVNESNTDVTDYFNISVDGNTVKATAKVEMFDKVEFYAHTYKLQIPVTVKGDTSNVEKITNKANTTSSICKSENDCPTDDLETNQVDVKMKYNLTVNYIEGSTKNVIAPKDVSDAIYYYNDEYKTNYNKVDLKMWRLDKSEVEVGEGSEKDKDSKIIEGNIKGNTIVNYYFERREYPVTVNYYDAETNEKIAESDKTIYYYTMNYYTNYDKIDRDVWEYVSTDGDEIEGVIDGEKESYTINYYFHRLKYKLLVNYFDDKTKAKIAESDRYIHNYKDKYVTNYDKIDENYWEYVRTEGETPGIIYEDTEADYYFKTNEFTILVNYYDKDTGEKIEDPEIESKKYGEEYTTNDDKVDKKKWDLVEVPNNAKGKVTGDIEVNYYYKKHEYKLKVNYYDKKTGNKIVETTESTVYYGDKYVTDYGIVDGRIWQLVGIPENYQGEVTGDIEVNYYFNRIGGTNSQQPGINNPQTGSNQNIVIIEIVTVISIILIVINTIYKIYIKKKIYKI